MNQIRPDNMMALAKLYQAIGRENVLVEDAREYYATDVYRRLELPLAVVRPGSIEELQRTVEIAYGEGLAIFPRGGGASYTSGYLVSTPHAITIDAGRLNKIVEINKQDMYVTVEPGVTWAVLDNALAPHGLRVPFRGPFSGLAATVGGSISQNTLGLGTNTFGVSAESVLAVEVVVGDGKMVKTGQAGSSVGKPFFRFFGPDLTGLFTGDCGALGVKARITLRLMNRRPHFDCLSFGFPSFEAAHACIAETAGYTIEEKVFALDTALQQGQIGKNSGIATKVELAAEVVKSAKSVVSGLKQVAGMGLAGTKALENVPFAAHYIFEGLSEGEVKGKAELLRLIAKKYGWEIPNSVPLVVHATPFAPLHNILGPAGERWVPLHGILPNSAVVAFNCEVVAYLDARKHEMQRKSVYIGRIFSSLGTGAMLYEPAIYWKDAQTVYHSTMLDDAYQKSIPKYPSNPEGAALVQAIRTDLIDLFHKYGAGHLQVGKLYPLLRDRNTEAVNLLRAIKAALDPKGLINPGALALNS